MPRKYIRLCLSNTELERITQDGVKLNAISHQAIANWEMILPEQQQQLMKLRQILYINEPPIIKIIGADRIISAWLITSASKNESLTLSTAIGAVLSAGHQPPLMVPNELAQRLRSIGGDPIDHLQTAVEKYLINC